MRLLLHADGGEMRWFRSIRRVGAGLGLVALLLQLALSFDHIHPDELLLGSFASLADEVAAKAHQPLTGPDQAPGSPHHDCPICSVMHLAGAVVLPSPPSLLLPTQFAMASFVANDCPSISVIRRLAFQTRAPPPA